MSKKRFITSQRYLERLIGINRVDQLAFADEPTLEWFRQQPQYAPYTALCTLFSAGAETEPGSSSAAPKKESLFARFRRLSRLFPDGLPTDKVPEELLQELLVVWRKYGNFENAMIDVSEVDDIRETANALETLMIRYNSENDAENVQELIRYYLSLSRFGRNVDLVRNSIIRFFRGELFNNQTSGKDRLRLLKHILEQKSNIEKKSFEQYKLRKQSIASLGMGAYLEERPDLPQHLLGLVSLEATTAKEMDVTRSLAEAIDRGWFLVNKS